MKLNDKSKLVAIRLTIKQYEELENLATKMKVSMSEVIRQFIDSGLSSVNDGVNDVVNGIIQILMSEVSKNVRRNKN